MNGLLLRAYPADQPARECKKFSAAGLFSNKCLIYVRNHGHRPFSFSNL